MSELIENVAQIVGQLERIGDLLHGINEALTHTWTAKGGEVLTEGIADAIVSELDYIGVRMPE